MKVGIIGVGAIAQVHIPAVAAAGQTITALCDTDVEKCVAANRKFGLNARVYADYKEMIDREKPDAVHVCTPHCMHAEAVCYALDRNVNVLCEKPLAIDFSQLDEIESAVGRSSARLGVCQQNRFRQSMLFVKDYFSDKKITAASGNLCWRRDKAYYESGAWRGDKSASGGGVVINQALHTLDALQWLCGMPVSVVGHTFCDTLKDFVSVEETAFGIFNLPDGGRFVLSASNECSTSFPVTIMLRSEADVAVIIDDNIILNGKFLTKSDGAPAFGKEVWGTGHVALTKKFYESLRTGEKFEIDFYEARKVVTLLLRLYESEGKEILI